MRISSNHKTYKSYIFPKTSRGKRERKAKVNCFFRCSFSFFYQEKRKHLQTFNPPLNSKAQTANLYIKSYYTFIILQTFIKQVHISDILSWNPWKNSKSESSTIHHNNKRQNELPSWPFMQQKLMELDRTTQIRSSPAPLCQHRRSCER